MTSWWQRIKQRKLVQWALAYLAVAVLLVGFASDLAQGFAWAVVVLRVLVAVLAAGFLAALVVAWYHGELGRQRVPLTEAVLLIGVLIAGVVAVWFVVGTSRRAPTSHTKASAALVAVLPCDFAGEHHEFAFLASGLAEQVITRLTQFAAIRPIAFKSVLRYAAGDKDYAVIGRELNATAIVDCSIRSDARSLRVTFHLVDPRTQAELWTEPFVRDLDDLVGADGEIALEVARGLNVRLTRTEQTRADRFQRPRSREAWFEYLQGLQLLTPFEANLRRATRHFENAIALDPTYAPAHAGLADALSNFGFFGIAPPREARDSARAAAQRALGLDQELGQAHAAAALIKFFFDWDWSGAEADFRRALELNPTSAQVLFHYANFQTAMGRHADAIALMKESVELDPLNPFAHGMLASSYFQAGRVDEAIEQASATAVRFPQHAEEIGILLAWFHAERGDYEQSLQHVQRAEAAARDDPWLITILGVAYAHAGAVQEAARLLAKLEVIARERYVDPRNFAFLYGALGDTAKALDAAESAYRLGSPGLTFVRSRDYFWAPLREKPRYQAIVEKMRFPPNP